MVFGKAVDGDGDAHARQGDPFLRDGDDAAGDDQREDVHGAEGREDFGEFAMADERFAAD